MDLLQKCAQEFDRLVPYQYHIIIGRKGKTLEYTRRCLSYTIIICMMRKYVNEFFLIHCLSLSCLHLIFGRVADVL